MPDIASLDAEHLIRELAQLWKTLASDTNNADAGASGVLRACAMTLIAVVDESRPLDEVNEVIAQLMHEHPSRAVTVRIPESDHPLSSRVFAQCWLPFGRRQQICCEQIELTVGRREAGDLAPLLRGLTVPDLPVVVWAASPEVLALPELQAVTELADEVLFDSDRTSDPLEFLRARATSPRRVADLAWTRLTRWRESIAQAFEPAEARARIPSIRKVTIDYSTPQPAIGTRYLAAWLVRSLGPQATCELRAVTAEPPRAVCAVSLAAAGGAAIQLTRAGETLEVHSSQLSAQGRMPHYGEYELLREELSVLGRDTIYPSVLRDILR